ncbi:MAG: hypothetical protein ACOX3T_05650 [Bdellovibrionota bacterium]
MKAKYVFCLQILIFILVYSILFKMNNDTPFSYNLKAPSLESYQSLNVPCLSYNPSLWEIEQISGVSLKQAKEIKKILDTNKSLTKKEFIDKLIKIKGIGKKKSNKIAKIFYY